MINHAVTNVGYGHDAASNLDYWISNLYCVIKFSYECVFLSPIPTVRNSWGPGWEESGYVRIQKGVNMCGIETAVYYVIVA